MVLKMSRSITRNRSALEVTSDLGDMGGGVPTRGELEPEACLEPRIKHATENEEIEK